MLSYFNFNGKFIAAIPKCGSFSDAQAIHDALGLDIKDAVLKFAIPQTATPEGTVYVKVRDPLERFLSACATFGMTVEVGLASDEPHFGKQSDYVIDGRTKIFLFPEQYTEFCMEVGIPEYHLNQRVEKPVATAKQIKQIKARYASDYALRGK